MSEPTQEDIILVIGGTGTQGFETVRALVSHSTSSNPITVHALVRDPESSKSQALAQLSPSVKLFQGDYNTESTIAAAAESCTAAFFILSTDWKDATAEQRQLNTILSVLSKIPTVKRVVYTNALGVKDPNEPGNFTGVEKGSLRYNYLNGKYANEVTLKKVSEQNGWAWTILRPGFFLSNFLNPMAKLQHPNLARHRIVTVMPTDYQNHFIDPADIGQCSAVALLGPGKGRNLPDLSSRMIDLFTQKGLLEDATSAMERALTKQGIDVKITVEHVTPEEADKMGIPSVKVQSEQFLTDNPPTVDYEGSKNLGFEFGTIDGFFEREVDRVKEVLAL